MQKNVMVQDAAGQIIGNTYPKRAKGLLKSGRAVLVDDHTIQLCASAQNTAAPILKKELHMEDLLFCAPAFSTKSRFSTLLTVTDADGDPMELWELDATEETTSATISAQLQQLPKTAYQFRFTLAGSSETERIRCTVQTDTDTKTYALEQGRYQSDSRKNADGTLLRTFSLPITSGTDGKVSIQFTVKQACMQILPVQPDAVLQALPAYSYQEWKQDASRAANPIVDLSNAKLPKSALLQILATCGANTTISLENADIYNDME